MQFTTAILYINIPIMCTSYAVADCIYVYLLDNPGQALKVTEGASLKIYLSFETGSLCKVKCIIPSLPFVGRT